MWTGCCFSPEQYAAYVGEAVDIRLSAVPVAGRRRFKGYFGRVLRVMRSVTLQIDDHEFELPFGDRLIEPGLFPG